MEEHQMSIRLIFSDVDGTILPRGGKISDRTRQAVQDCTANGIPFVICSGRWYISALPVARELGIAGVLEGGASAPTSRSNSAGFARRSCDAKRGSRTQKKERVSPRPPSEKPQNDFAFIAAAAGSAH